MNILLIGNGFDLAHGLPTKYVDFLEFCKRIKEIFLVGCKTFEKDYLNNWKINNEIKEMLKKEYSNRKLVKQFYDNGTYSIKIVTQSEILNELYNLIKDNVWIEYFFECDMFQKENWIDFETEISRVIKFLNEIVCVSSLRDTIEKLPDKLLDEILNNLQLDFTCGELRDRLLNDLNKFIRAFEIYLTEYVGKINVEMFSPDIKDIMVKTHEDKGQKRAVFTKVLSFNYTNTYEKMYLKGYDVNVDNCIDYIHGKADIENTIETNNMVLGIDEYLQDDRKDKEIVFVAFKKYYQRIYKETGCKYKKWVDNIQNKYNTYLKNKQICYDMIVSARQRGDSIEASAWNKKYKDIVGRCEMDKLYIFGHSLDITDKDILRDLILNDNVYTTIFYINKDVMGQQIANLVKVIGQDELIKRTGGSTKTIEFRPQRNMVPIENKYVTSPNENTLSSTPKNMKNP